MKRLASLISEWSACPEGAKKKTRTYKITREAKNGGAACAHKDGATEEGLCKCVASTPLKRKGVCRALLPSTTTINHSLWTANNNYKCTGSKTSVNNITSEANCKTACQNDDTCVASVWKPVAICTNKPNQSKEYCESRSELSCTSSYYARRRCQLNPEALSGCKGWRSNKYHGQYNNYCKDGTKTACNRKSYCRWFVSSSSGTCHKHTTCTKQRESGWKLNMKQSTTVPGETLVNPNDTKITTSDESVISGTAENKVIVDGQLPEPTRIGSIDMQAAMSAGGDYWKSWTNKVCLVGKLEGNQKFEKCLSQDKARRRSRSYQQTKSASFQLQPPVLVDSVEVRHKHSKTSGSGTSSAKNVNVEIFSPDLPTDCKGQWSPWSNCSDAGKKTRTFKVQRAAAKGGKACTNEADAKEEESCPVACKGEWSSWSACHSTFFGSKFAGRGQAGTAMLAQANSSPQSVLSLLQ